MLLVQLAHLKYCEINYKIFKPAWVCRDKLHFCMSVLKITITSTCYFNVLKSYNNIHVLTTLFTCIWRYACFPVVRFLFVFIYSCCCSLLLLLFFFLLLWLSLLFHFVFYSLYSVEQYTSLHPLNCANKVPHRTLIFQITTEEAIFLWISIGRVIWWSAIRIEKQFLWNTKK